MGTIINENAIIYENAIILIKRQHILNRTEYWAVKCIALFLIFLFNPKLLFLMNQKFL